MADGTTDNLPTPFSALQAAAASVRPEAFPRTREEAALTLQKMHMSFSGVLPGTQASPFFAAALAYLHAQWSPWEYTVAWAVAVTVYWFILYPGLPSKSHSTDPAATRLTIQLTLLKLIGFAAIFASQGFLFWVPGDAINHFAIALVLLGSSLVCLMSAAWLPGSLASFSIYMVTVIALLSSEGGAYTTLTVLTVAFSSFFLSMIAYLHGFCLRLISLQDHKDVLIRQLMSSNKAKSDFLANMSHELRTPMNAILGFSEVIKDELMGPSNKPIYRNYAADIHASGAHLLGLINDILDLSKIESGKFELKEREFDLFDIAEIAVRMVTLKIEEKQISLTVSIPKGVTIWGDPHAFKQIALNIASNAVKFTPKGGRIDVWLSCDADFMTIHTRDSGCGIRPEDMDRVFESFGQGRHDVVIGDKGTGLGLPIVRGLMRAHGGDATLVSDVGKGTEVRLTVPLTRVRAQPIVQQAVA